MPIITKRRLSLFVSRWLKARRYGFNYKGTTQTPFPESLTIFGKAITLLPPMGNECVYDLFNVLLDDEYGLSDLERPNVIVDIGVNMGIFSLAAWSRYPDAKVYGYEPGPGAFTRASHNLNVTGAILFNEAVGLTSGMCTISDSTQSRLAKALVADSGNIPVTPFSEVLTRAGGFIDLLKMDCEGAEWDILKDRDSMRFVRSIRMEYHLDGKRTLDDFKDLILAGDHRIVRLVEERGHGIAWLENTRSVLS
jgi:FkbM family methyltransferase